MGTLSNKYFNAQAVEDALDKGVAAYDSMGQIELVYNGTDIRFNNEVVNFQQIVDYITTDTRFCYMVYNNRVLLTSDMQLTGGTRYVFFETSTTDSGLSKNAVVKVYSSDGTTISSISHSTIANENFNNKVSTIADNDKNSTVHYPSNKAVTEITDEIKEDLSEVLENSVAFKQLSYTDLNEVNENGVYHVSSTTGISNLPTNTPGVLVVMKAHTVRALQVYATNSSSSKSRVYLRNRVGSLVTGSYNYTEWFEITKDVGIPDAEKEKIVMFKGTLAVNNYTDLDSVAVNGIYHVDSYNGITNLPVQSPGTLVIMAGRINRLLQIYIPNSATTKPIIYARIKKGSTSTTEGTFTEWADIASDGGNGADISKEPYKKIITWVADDNIEIAGMERIERVCNAVGCKATLAVVTDKNRFPSHFEERIEKLHEMHSKGHHICSHGGTHTDWYREDGEHPILTFQEIEEDLIRSISFLRDEGFLESDMLIYPGHSRSRGIEVAKIAKKWCKCGVHLEGGINTSANSTQYTIKREFLSTFTDDTLASEKSIIDNANKSSEIYWLVYGTHCDLDSFDEEYMKKLLNYAVSQGWEIMTLNEALKYRERYYDDTL